MYEKTIKSLSKLAGVSLVIPVNEYLLKENTPGLISIILAIVVSVFIMFLVELILYEFPLYIIWARRCLIPLSKFEGCWIQTLRSSQRPYSICWIEYDTKKKKYKYWGDAYTVTGEQEANWYSDNLTYMDPYGFYFFGKGYITETTSNDPIENWGYLRFSSNAFENKQFDSGTGFSVDLGNESSSSILIFERITKSLLHELSGCKTLKTQEDFRDFIIKYHARSEELLRRNGTLRGQHNSHTRQHQTVACEE